MSDSLEKSEGSTCVMEAASTSSDTTSRSLPEEAFQHFLQGKRHVLVQDYTFAVASLATACELYVKHYGELALECGEVYFLYGKALFRLSQQQSGVLGEVLNESSNEEEEGEGDSSDEGKENESDKNASDEEDEEKEGEAETAEEETEPSESTDSPQTLNDDARVEESVTSGTATEESATAAPADSSVKEESTQEAIASTSSTVEAVPGSSKSEEKDNEEDDLELAWNTLEMAKTIFSKQGKDNQESQLKVAEILKLLAEISMESNNYSSSIQDLKECLAIQQQYLKTDDRFLADTYYQMGLVHVLDEQYHEGIENFRTTMSIIEQRIKNLKSLPKPEKFDFESDPTAEITSLESILPDINEKIEDTEELIRNAKKELEEAFGAAMEVSTTTDNIGSTGGSSSSGSSITKTISNVNHLLKRKKPEQVGETDAQVKRVKLTPVPNGDLNQVQPDTTSN